MKIQSHLYSDIELCFVPDTEQRTVLKINDKSAATNSLTFSAIDPKRADEKMFDLYYEPTDINGDIVTKSSGTVDWTEI